MKKIHFLIIAILCALGMASCDDDDGLKIGNNIVPPVLEQLLPENYVITESTILTDNVGYWRWKHADYGYSAAVKYTVEADTVDGTFDSPITLTDSDQDFALITAGMLNTAGLKIAPEESKIVSLDIRIRANLYKDDKIVDVPPVYSNIQSITFTTYFDEKAPVYPDQLYMIGKEFGDWSWGSEDIVEMTPIFIDDQGNGKGQFWCIRYFTANEGFKWSPVKAFNGDFAQLDEIVGYTVSGNDAVVAENGLYTVFVDMPNGRISVQPAEVYGMGDCFGGWDMQTYPFTIDGKLFKKTTTNGGELRMYGGSPAMSSIDWWKREFIIIDGKIEYRGTGGDQQRVQVPSGSNVVLDFNTGTGSF